MRFRRRGCQYFKEFLGEPYQSQRSLTNQRTIFENPLTFSKEQMSSSILFMIREILDDSFYVLRCGHEQVNGLEFWLRVSFTCYRFNYCGSSSDQWAMDLLWYQISPYKSHFLRGYRTVEVLPLAVFANDHRPPVFSTFRAGWRISALPNTLESWWSEGFNGEIWKDPYCCVQSWSRKSFLEQETNCCQVSQLLRIFPAPFVVAPFGSMGSSAMATYIYLLVFFFSFLL